MEAGHRVAGRYHLLEPIGRGGMGVVWRAHDELLDRTVAVKEVLHQPMSEEERTAFNRRTIREARAAGRISHPNVVVVHDVIEEDGRPWIVMQLVEARSLGEVLREHGPLIPERVAAIGLQILDALRTAHTAGVLHRDVKPENVLLRGNGQIVLTDFGIATMPEEVALTMTGGIVGTPAFLPPERLNGHPATPESDLWSLGATLYAAVEGRSPFDRSSPIATMAAVLHNEPDSPRLAGALNRVIEGLLRKDPAQRIDAVETAELLAAAAAGSAVQVGPSVQGSRGVGGGTDPKIVHHNESVFDPRSLDPRSFDPRSQVPRSAVLTPPPGSEQFAPPPPTIPPWGQAQAAPPPSWHASATLAKPARRPLRKGVALFVLTPVLLVVALLVGSYVYPGLWAGFSESPSDVDSEAYDATLPTASPSASPSRSGALPRGWTTHRDELGFSIALPPGWEPYGREASRVRFGVAGSATYLMIDLTRWTDTDQDPMLHMQQLEQNPKARAAFPGYRLIGLYSRTYRGGPAADWEFTWQAQSGKVHVLDRALTTNGKDFAIYWQTADTQWNKRLSYFKAFTTTFRTS